MSSFTLSQLSPHLPELLAVVMRLTLSAAYLLDQHRQLVKISNLLESSLPVISLQIQPCFIATLKTIRQLSINCIAEVNGHYRMVLL